MVQGFPHGTLVELLDSTLQAHLDWASFFI
jgi:hypothetical protein